MAPPSQQQPQPSPFHRFRLNDFQRVDPSSASLSAGQCSRFRVTDFVPWGDGQQPGGQAAANGAGRRRGQSTSSASASPPSTAGTGKGGFSVMHMDVDSCAPQQTSTAVAAAASAGSGKGMLQVKNVGPRNAIQQLQPKPASSPVTPAAKTNVFDPARYPEDIRWELAKVLGIMRTTPAEAVVTTICNRLMVWPSLEEGSLLRRMAEVFSSQLPPPPQAAPPSSAASPAQPENQVPVKRKRGRPKKDSYTPNTSTSTVPVVNTAGQMPPPPPPQKAQVSHTFPVLPISASKKDKDTFLTCTRCLKPFNPAWRPTPQSDPSSEATCAVRHPYPDFASGLDVCLPGKRKNAYKTTWRWKCCGREVQSTSDEPLQWPRKEDDTTQGWCFVGKHTTDPTVREKIGLKSGKGKRLTEDPSNKKAEDNAQSVANGNHDVQPQQQAAHTQHFTQAVPLQAPQEEMDETQEEPPPKRKRGRPKGSKTKKNLNLAMVTPSPTTTFVPLGQSSAQTSPGTQLLSEATSSVENHADSAVNGDHTANFWSQYTDPYTTGTGQSQSRDDDQVEDDEGGPSVDALGMSSVELGMLVNATAAMGGRAGGSEGGGGGASAGVIGAEHIQQQQRREEPAEPEKPVKRGRGRPKGVKNGTGKTSKRKTEPSSAPPPPPVQESSPVSPVMVQDGGVNADGGGAGGGNGSVAAWSPWPAHQAGDWYTA